MTPAPKKPDDKSQALEWAKVALMPVVTVLITVVGGFYLTGLTNARAERARNDQLYAQLLTQREQSDTTIRKDMFQVVIGKFMTNEPQDLTDKVLQIELLANNFNQSLDLAPLFKDMARRLTKNTKLPTTANSDLLKRLQRTASNVIFKQVNSLSRRGFVHEETFSVGGWEERFGKPFIDETLSIAKVLQLADDAGPGVKGQAHFRAEVVDVNLERREIEVRLRIDFSNPAIHDIDRHFWVGEYEFPMLDNTHLPYGLRTSIVMTDFYMPDSEADREENTFVKFHLLVFPSASASFKERQDYDDILLDMLRAERNQREKQL